MRITYSRTRVIQTLGSQKHFFELHKFPSYRIFGIWSIFHEKYSGEGKLHLVSEKPNVSILQNLGSKWY